MKAGKYDIPMPLLVGDELDSLGVELLELAKRLEYQEAEVQQINMLTSQINAGLLLEEILENVYKDFRTIIPFDRIGFSVVEEKSYTVKAIWMKSELPVVYLGKGYEATLHGSSLEEILKTGRPRIINDLSEYLRDHPDSESTRLIIKEGLASSLTFPLVANDRPIGFLYISSRHPGVYTPGHVESLRKITGQLSVIVEKGLMVSRLSEQKKVIEQKNKELQRLDHIRNTWLAVAAHDLRNPITYIQLASQVLLEEESGKVESQALEILNHIFNNAKYLSHLLNDLLDLTKLDSEEFSINVVSIPLESFLNGLVDDYGEWTARKESKIIVEPIPPGYIHADPLRLRQVVDNLVSNAIKFSPPGSLIKIRAFPIKRAWKIEVQDQGPGILPEDRTRLFKEFSRLSSRPTAGEKSTGLGLAITQRIIQAHQGEIGVDSKPGAGATFWVTLPIASSAILPPSVQIAARADQQKDESS